MKFFLPGSFFVFFSLPCFCQLFPAKDYPQHYFRDPLNIPISLAGNFGEIRPNHFHMGLDIRTEKHTGLPVFAAADGYISKVKVEPEGFGQAIYIRHPNGYTTLYAHLNDFFPALSAYVQQQQYQLESWQVFLDIPPSLFPVKKGDLIALSGSTGGSQAPHVHFEIRKSAEDVNLNPTLFGLPIIDRSSPVILRVAVYDGTRSIYEQSPRIYPVKRVKGVLTIGGGNLITNSPKARFALSAFDTETGTSNHNGIYQAVLYKDAKAQIGFEMDGISYAGTRGVNAHIDYKTKSHGGPILQQLFRLSGYQPSIYSPSNQDGVVDLRDGAAHPMKIEAKDAHGHSTAVVFSIRYRPGQAVGARATGKMFYPGMRDGDEHPACAFYIGEHGLYDSVHLSYKQSDVATAGAVSAVHWIGSTDIPLQDSLLVRIKPNIDLDPGKKDKVVMLRSGGGKKDVSKVLWQNGWASARFRDFGNFQLVVDQEPPTIISVGFADGANLSRASRLVFLVKDNLGSYGHFRAELDGKWLRFTNDKGRSFIYQFDGHCPPGPHVLKVSVQDEAGNMAEKVYHFIR